MSATNTTTSAAAITYLPNPGAQVDYQAAFGELLQICDALRTNRPDFLSSRLFHWATSVIQAARANGNANPDSERIARAIHARIDELVQDILVNPLSFNPVTRGNNPLIDPLRERDWVWERGDHEACQTLFPQSPLDGGEMLPEPPQHIPAKRMLVWAAAVQGQVPLTSMVTLHSPFNPQSMQVLPRDPRIDQMRRIIYTKLCRDALSQRRDQKFRQHLECSAALADQRMTVIHGLSSQVIAHAQEEERIAELAIRSKLEGVDRAHRQALDGLQQQLNEQKTAHQAQEIALKAQIAQRDQTQTATIHLLDAQVAWGNEAQKVATSGLQEQINALSAVQTNQVFNLEAQLEWTTQQHITDVTNITETENRADSLENELGQTRDQLQNAFQSLATQQAQTAQEAAQIQQLERRVNAAMRSAYGY